MQQQQEELQPASANSEDQLGDPILSSSFVRRDFNDSGVAGCAAADGYSRKSSVDSAGGSLFEASSRASSSSSSSECSDTDSRDDIHSLCSEDDCQEVLRQILQHDQPVQISIKLHVTEDQSTNWMTILNPNNNILYVAFPTQLPPAGSKQTFLSLLEFAEDKLEVDGIVLVMRKDQLDCGRLIESFLFMGFEPLSRKSPKAPPAAINDNGNYYFLYNIEE